MKLWALKDVWGVLVPERVGVEEAEGDSLGLLWGVPLAIGVCEGAGLAEAAPEGLTELVKLWALKVPSEELVRDCVELPDTEEDPVELGRALKLRTGVPEAHWLPEREFDAVPLPVNV